MIGRKTGTSDPYRLAAVTSHPVQYQAPWFQRLAAHTDIDLTVFYGHDESVIGDVDRDFGVRVAWDRPLLDGYRSIFLRRSAQPLTAIQRLVAESRIIGHLARGRFDAVFIHSYATRLSLFAYVGAVVSRTPILLRTESQRFRPRPFWISIPKELLLRTLFAFTSGVLVIGQANRQFFDHYGVPRARQFFTPYSVDNDYFVREHQRLRPSRSELRRGFGFQDNVVVVGFSGKLIPRKGVTELIDAVGTLQNEGLPVGVLLIGDGPDRAALEADVATRGLRWIVFAGFKNQSELPSCFVCLDVFVLPSRFDPWGLVVNEAMAFGLPVVATDMVGASLDLIKDGRNGYIYPSGDVGALADALRQLVTRPDTRAELGQCSKTIVERYSYGECVRGMVAALQHVVPVSDRERER